MVKELIHDPIFLAQRSQIATAADLQAAQDLADTLVFHRQTCVGMAANMIGVARRIIAFYDGDNLQVMFNQNLKTPSKNIASGTHPHGISKKKIADNHIVVLVSLSPAPRLMNSITFSVFIGCSFAFSYFLNKSINLSIPSSDHSFIDLPQKSTFSVA